MPELNTLVDNTTIDMPADALRIKPTGTPQVARLGIGAAADATVALKVVGQLWIPLVDDGNSGASKTIDWNDGNEHLLTLTGNCAIDFDNPQDGGRYVLILATGAGGFAPTFPGEVLWPGGTPPTITTDPAKYDLITFIYLGSGSPTLYLASINQDYS